jgi:hypothetical protein
MQSPNTSSSGENPPSMFDQANAGKWGYDGMVRPTAQNLDDVLLLASVNATKVGDTFPLDGTSLEAVTYAFTSSRLSFKASNSKRVFFVDDRGSICAIDYDPTREEAVKFYEVGDVYSALQRDDVASFGVLKKILKDHPNIFHDGHQVEVEGNRRVYVFAQGFALRLQKFIDEE